MIKMEYYLECKKYYEYYQMAVQCRKFTIELKNTNGRKIGDTIFYRQESI